MNLRDYQYECGQTVAKCFCDGIRRQLVVLPTGTGKSVIAAHLAQQAKTDRPILFLAHRGELLQNFAEKVKALAPHFSIGYEIGSAHARGNENVILASVQSATKPDRLKRLASFGIQHVMTDEAHHAPADSYRYLYEALTMLPGQKTTGLHVGFTATPLRSDHVALGCVFDAVTFARSIKEMIQQGYICCVRGCSAKTNVLLDKGAIASPQSDVIDLRAASLEKVVNVSKRNKAAVSAYRQAAKTLNARRPRAIVTCVSVQHAHDMAEAFNDADIAAVAVHGGQSVKERLCIAEQLGAGQEIHVVTFSDVWMEGIDIPAIEVVIMARPTKSGVVYCQGIGRGLRPWPGKEVCVVSDLVDNSSSHSLVTLPTVMDAYEPYPLEKRVDERIEDRVRSILVSEIWPCPHCWMQVGGDDWKYWKLSAGQGDWLEIRIGYRSFEVVRVNCNTGAAEVLTRSDWIGDVFKKAEPFVPLVLGDRTEQVTHKSPWRQTPAAAEDIKLLAEVGIDDAKTQGDVSNWQRALKEPGK